MSSADMQFQAVGEIAPLVLPPKIRNEPVDERRLFRGRVIRAFKLAPHPHFYRDDLRLVFQAARYEWHETEFQLMARDGIIICSKSEGGQIRFSLAREHF